MLKGHLPSVIHRQVYQYTKKNQDFGKVWRVVVWVYVVKKGSSLPNN